MKKALTPVLAIVAAVAIILSCVFGTQKGNLQKTVETVQAELAGKTGELEQSAADAAAKAAEVESLTAQVETLKGELETKLAEAAEAAKAETEKQVADAKAAAQKEIDAAKAEAATAQEALTALQTDAASAAETARTETEKQVTDAKAAAQKEIDAAKAETATAQEALTAAETARAELETAKTEAENARAELEGQIADLQGQLEKTQRALVAAQSNAYIMYANADWSVQNWGTADSEDGSVKVTPAAVNGAGTYTVGLEFATPAEGLAFTALGIQKGEQDFPGGTIEITAIRINGEAVELKKGYTSSDDGKETRMNIYNEWVSDVPADARRADQDLTDAAPVIVDKEAFASVSSMEVDFTFQPLTAYLMYADGAWAMQNWGTADSEDGSVKVTGAAITGAGEYTVGLEFATPAEGLAFTAIGIKNGEKTFPGYIIKATKATVNDGEENLLTGIGYTNADDGQETRENLYNEWVDAANLPADARNEEGLEGASPIIVNKDAFTGVTKVTVTFSYIKGQPAAAPAEEAMSEDEAKALKEAGFHAYIAVQGKDTYVFRNAWNDAYGMNDEANPFFYRLTGWDTDNNAVDYGGSFADAEIKADGEYTVSLTTGEMGFGTTQAFNLLFVSTDIPSKLVKDGYLTLDNVKTKIGGAATQDFTSVDLEGEYARIVVLDSYNQSAEPFGYTVPGAGESISISFTVSGF